MCDLGHDPSPNIPATSFTSREAIRGPGVFDATGLQIRWWLLAIILIIASGGLFGWWASGNDISHHTTAEEKRTSRVEPTSQMSPPSQEVLSYRVLRNRLPQVALLCLGIVGSAGFLRWYDRHSQHHAARETKGNSDVR